MKELGIGSDRIGALVICRIVLVFPDVLKRRDAN